MNNFFVKTTFVSILIILIYNTTIGPIINKSLAPILKISDFAIEKQERLKVKDKLLKSLEKASSKERYLTKEEAQIISDFIKKISNELDMENSERKN